MGRKPLQEGSKSRDRLIRAPEAFWAELDAWAREQEIPASEAIRRIVSERIKPPAPRDD